jgi:hypothetical protein
MLQRTFLMCKKQQIYILPPKRLLALNGGKCQGVKGCKGTVTVLMCCKADGSHKFHPPTAGKFEEMHCWKDLKPYPCNYKSPRMHG